VAVPCFIEFRLPIGKLDVISEIFMERIFVIEDELHCEPQEGQFSTLEEAVIELRRRAIAPWDAKPNEAPCMNWRNCGRRYEIIEYDIFDTPWKELRRMPALEVSARGAHWLGDFRTVA